MAGGLRLEEAAPAKINLALHVTGQRGDGYHLLDSLVTFADFGDSLTFEPADEDRFSVSGSFADDVPRTDDPETGNLVLKARNGLRSLGRSKGAECPPVHIHLKKELPPAAGIGGGSADAAATLRGLVKFWNIQPDHDAFKALGLTLGADVPMCLAKRPLIARGVGEDITEATMFPALFMVLANPLIPVSTPAVFKALQHKHQAPLLTGEPPRDAGGWYHLVEESRNDLSLPARSIVPKIGSVLDILYAAKADLVRMSGSGATCFGLYPSAEAAEEAAAHIKSAQPEWFVVAVRTVTSGR